MQIDKHVCISIKLFLKWQERQLGDINKQLKIKVLTLGLDHKILTICISFSYNYDFVFKTKLMLNSLRPKAMPSKRFKTYGQTRRHRWVAFLTIPNFRLSLLIQIQWIATPNPFYK